MNTLEKKLEMKLAAQEKEDQKKENLRVQIEMYQKSLERLEESSRTRLEEIAYLESLAQEHLTLSVECDRLMEELARLMAEYESTPWSPENAPYEEWVETSGFSDKLAEKDKIQERLVELEKLANKAYYRR